MSITVVREGSGERKQDEYINELWNKIREKERRIVELEEQLGGYQRTLGESIEREDKLREALQNIANGDTPWMDGYSETPGEIYQKYAQQSLRGG